MVENLRECWAARLSNAASSASGTYTTKWHYMESPGRTFSVLQSVIVVTSHHRRQKIISASDVCTMIRDHYRLAHFTRNCTTASRLVSSLALMP